MAEHVCPVWIGYLLASPLRKLLQDPVKILEPHVKPGMQVLDAGPAMGFFSLPMARLVGPGGKVVCVDLQEKMIRSLEKRARKADLLERIEGRTCTPDSLQLDDAAGRFDFALAFAVVHEVPDAARFFSEICPTLKEGGRLLVAEPSGHVSGEDFEASLSAAAKAGFNELERPKIRRSLTALLERTPL